MPEITENNRITRYREAPDHIRDLYASEELSEKIIALAETYGLNQNIRNISALIGDTILGFYLTRDLPTLLEEKASINADIAQRILVDIAEFLTPVLDREAMLVNPKLGAMKELHQQFQQAGGTVAAPATIAEAAIPPVVEVAPEAPLEPVHNVTPMRTMAADMSRVHGYGAYRQVNPQPGEDGVVRAAPQDEILKERPRLTNTPQLGN